MLDPADAGDELSRLGDPRLEVPAIGDDDLAAPSSRASRVSSRASAAEAVIGFSMSTWQPFSSAALACSKWATWGEEMTTPSIGTASSISRKSSKASGMAKVTLDLGELRLAEPIDGDDLAIG